LDRHIDQIKEAGKGRTFDCVVGISGGRDSTYLLHQLVRRHGLRCLAAYHRTPFTPDVIDTNVKKITQKLNVPLIEMNISREYHRKIAKRMVLLWLKKPLPVIANAACAPCKQHNREILKIAKQNNVRYLVMGSNKYEVFQISSGHQGEPSIKKFSYSRKIIQTLKLFRKGIHAMGQSYELIQFLPIGIKSVLSISPDSPYLRFLYSSVNNLNYFYYTDWNEKECEQVINEIGWELPPNCNSSWRADCAFAEVKNYMFLKMSGITYADAFFSNQIRAGVISRDEVLRRFEIENRPSAGRLSEACKIMEISTDLFV
jgi:glutamine---fructose-6-phosphate transaminase (isomerizing)